MIPFPELLIDTLPEITQEDEIFAGKISQDYNAPIEGLSRLIREVRFYLSEWADDCISKADYQKIFGADVEIRGISITTNKGTIETKSPDIFFFWCYLAIRGIRSKVENDINSANRSERSTEEVFLLELIMLYFSKTSLPKLQQRAAIGLFLVYFKIGNPPLTEQEFKAEKNKGKFLNTQDYKRYLSDNIKSRLKKFQGIY